MGCKNLLQVFNQDFCVVDSIMCTYGHLLYVSISSIHIFPLYGPVKSTADIAKVWLEGPTDVMKL